MERRSESGTDGCLSRPWFYFICWISGLPDWEQSVCLRGKFGMSSHFFYSNLYCTFLGFQRIHLQTKWTQYFQQFCQTLFISVTLYLKKILCNPKDIFLSQSLDCIIKIPDLFSEFSLRYPCTTLSLYIICTHYSDIQ